MNILIVCDEYPPCQHGGIGTVVSLLARQYAYDGHNIFITGFYPYFRKARKHEFDGKVEVFRFFYGSRLRLKLSRHRITGHFINIKKSFRRYTKSIQRIIREKDIEIVEIADYNEAFVFSGPKSISFPELGIPVIVKLHGSHTFFSHLRKKHSYIPNIYRKELKLLKSASLIIGVSKYVLDTTYELFDLNNKKAIIYNPIPCEDSNKYDIENESIDVVFTGKIAEKKGIYSLLKAWKLVVREMPAARLHVYGSGNKSAFSKAYSILENPHLFGVHFHGYIQRDLLPDIYRNAACAIFPSFAEAFGMTPLESMSNGCPTIFTILTSGSEIIDDGIDGLLIDPGNIDEIRDALIFLLKNRKEAIGIGNKGFNKVKKDFDIKMIADLHIKIYSNILNNV